MGFRLRLLALAAVLLPLPAIAGTAQVTFKAPETFADAALHRGDTRERTENLERLRREIERLAGRLPDTQTLTVEVLDVDLAGRYEARLAPYDIRVMRSITPPRLTLRYALADGVKTVQAGETVLTDFNYLDKAGFLISQDPLRYEKRLLNDWFRDTFMRPARADG